MIPYELPMFVKCTRCSGHGFVPGMFQSRVPCTVPGCDKGKLCVYVTAEEFKEILAGMSVLQPDGDSINSYVVVKS